MKAEVIPIRGGYAAPPGSGPKGQTCGTSEHAYGYCGGSDAWSWPYSGAFCSKTQEAGDPPPPVRTNSPACHVWRARR